MSASEQEEQLIKDICGGIPVSLEMALLVLSGLSTDDEIRSYQGKLDSIFARFLGKCSERKLTLQPKLPLYHHREAARILFDYLWTSKPRRFGRNFLLTRVIDAQLDPAIEVSVGTCVGLTALYSLLGLRVGLNLTLLINSDHLLNRLRVGEETIDIDHTDPQGFAQANGKDFAELPLLMITASVLNSRGLDHEQNGRIAVALSDYDKAIRVYPEYANAYNNRGNMKLRLGDVDGAIADYTEAIRLNPGFFEALCNRGMAWQQRGRCDEARSDYQASLTLNKDYADARRCLQTLEEMHS